MVTNTGFRGFASSAYMVNFHTESLRLYLGGGASDHLCHQRLKHQYRDGLD